MKNSSDQWQVDDELLTETGRGGLFTDGYLQGKPLVSYLESSETPLFVFGSGKRGVTREGPDGTAEYTPASGYRAIVALTDRRVQFVVGGGGGDGDWSADVHLSNVDGVEVSEGLIREELTITTGDVDWQVPLKDVDTDRLVEFLEEISWAWIRVEQLLDETRKHLVDATRHQESQEFAEAGEQLQAARVLLDEASGITDALAEEATVAMREHLKSVEGRYHETRRRIHASRGAHIVGEAEQHWREDEYQRAYETFEQARSSYQSALDIEGLDPEKRASMRERVEHIDRNLEHLRTAPLQRAAQVRRRALEAEDPTERVEAWSETIERYRTVLELDWGRDERRFAGDVDRCRDRIAEAVDGLLDAREELAVDRRSRGDDLLARGEVSEARDCYSEAASQLEAAHQLARELAPDRAPSLRDRLDDIEDRLQWESLGEQDEDELEADEEFGWDEAWEGAVSAQQRWNGDPSADGADDNGSAEEGYDDFEEWVTLTPDDGAATASGETSTSPSTQTTDRDGTDRSRSPTLGDTPSAADREVQSPSTNGGEELIDENENLAAVVESLEPRALASVVTAVWDQRGWRTEETDADDVVLATRDDSNERRVLVTAPAATPRTVERARRARVAFDADEAILFVAERTGRTADEPRVVVRDAAGIASLVEDAGLVSLLRNVPV